MTRAEIVAELLAVTGASRVTLREPRPDAVFPVTEEALAPGVPSIRGVQTPNMAGQPVVLQVQQGRQVVQPDTRAAFDDPDFQAMLELYGGMRAQIVTPVLADGEVRGIISVHQLGEPREWTPADVETCAQAAARMALVLA